MTYDPIRRKIQIDINNVGSKARHTVKDAAKCRAVAKQVLALAGKDVHLALLSGGDVCINLKENELVVRSSVGERKVVKFTGKESRLRLSNTVNTVCKNVLQLNEDADLKLTIELTEQEKAIVADKLNQATKDADFIIKELKEDIRNIKFELHRNPSCQKALQTIFGLEKPDHVYSHIIKLINEVHGFKKEIQNISNVGGKNQIRELAALIQNKEDSLMKMKADIMPIMSFILTECDLESQALKLCSEALSYSKLYSKCAVELSSNMLQDVELTGNEEFVVTNNRQSQDHQLVIINSLLSDVTEGFKEILLDKNLLKHVKDQTQLSSLYRLLESLNPLLQDVLKDEISTNLEGSVLFVNKPLLNAVMSNLAELAIAKDSAPDGNSKAKFKKVYEQLVSTFAMVETILKKDGQEQNICNADQLQALGDIVCLSMEDQNVNVRKVEAFKTAVLQVKHYAKDIAAIREITVYQQEKKLFLGGNNVAESISRQAASKVCSDLIALEQTVLGIAKELEDWESVTREFEHKHINKEYIKDFKAKISNYVTAYEKVLFQYGNLSTMFEEVPVELEQIRALDFRKLFKSVFEQNKNVESFVETASFIEEIYKGSAAVFLQDHFSNEELLNYLALQKGVYLLQEMKVVEDVDKKRKLLEDVYSFCINGDLQRVRDKSESKVAFLDLFPSQALKDCALELLESPDDLAVLARDLLNSEQEIMQDHVETKCLRAIFNESILDSSKLDKKAFDSRTTIHNEIKWLASKQKDLNVKLKSLEKELSDVKKLKGWKLSYGASADYKIGKLLNSITKIKIISANLQVRLNKISDQAESGLNVRDLNNILILDCKILFNDYVKAYKQLDLSLEQCSDLIFKPTALQRIANFFLVSRKLRATIGSSYFKTLKENKRISFDSLIGSIVSGFEKITELSCKVHKHTGFVEDKFFWINSLCEFSSYLNEMSIKPNVSWSKFKVKVKSNVELEEQIFEAIKKVGVFVSKKTVEVISRKEIEQQLDELKDLCSRSLPFFLYNLQSIENNGICAQNSVITNVKVSRQEVLDKINAKLSYLETALRNNVGDFKGANKLSNVHSLKTNEIRCLLNRLSIDSSKASYKEVVSLVNSSFKDILSTHDKDISGSLEHPFDKILNEISCTVLLISKIEKEKKTKVDEEFILEKMGSINFDMIPSKSEVLEAALKLFNSNISKICEENDLSKDKQSIKLLNETSEAIKRIISFSNSRGCIVRGLNYDLIEVPELLVDIRLQDGSLKAVKKQFKDLTYNLDSILYNFSFPEGDRSSMVNPEGDFLSNLQKVCDNIKQVEFSILNNECDVIQLTENVFEMVDVLDKLSLRYLSKASSDPRYSIVTLKSNLQLINKAYYNCNEVLKTIRGDFKGDISNITSKVEKAKLSVNKNYGIVVTVRRDLNLLSTRFNLNINPLKQMLTSYADKIQVNKELVHDIIAKIKALENKIATVKEESFHANFNSLGCESYNLFASFKEIEVLADFLKAEIVKVDPKVKDKSTGVVVPRDGSIHQRVFNVAHDCSFSCGVIISEILIENFSTDKMRLNIDGLVAQSTDISEQLQYNSKLREHFSTVLLKEGQQVRDQIGKNLEIGKSCEKLKVALGSFLQAVEIENNKMLSDISKESHLKNGIVAEDKLRIKSRSDQYVISNVSSMIDNVLTYCESRILDLDTAISLRIDNPEMQEIDKSDYESMVALRDYVDSLMEYSWIYVQQNTKTEDIKSLSKIEEKAGKIRNIVSRFKQEKSIKDNFVKCSVVEDDIDLQFLNSQDECLDSLCDFISVVSEFSSEDVLLEDFNPCFEVLHEKIAKLQQDNKDLKKLCKVRSEKNKHCLENELHKASCRRKGASKMVIDSSRANLNSIYGSLVRNWQLDDEFLQSLEDVRGLIQSLKGNVLFIDQGKILEHFGEFSDYFQNHIKNIESFKDSLTNCSQNKVVKKGIAALSAKLQPNTLRESEDLKQMLDSMNLTKQIADVVRSKKQQFIEFCLSQGRSQIDSEILFSVLNSFETDVSSSYRNMDFDQLMSKIELDITSKNLLNIVDLESSLGFKLKSTVDKVRIRGEGSLVGWLNKQQDLRNIGIVDQDNFLNCFRDFLIKIKKENLVDKINSVKATPDLLIKKLSSMKQDILNQQADKGKLEQLEMLANLGDQSSLDVKLQRATELFVFKDRQNDFFEFIDNYKPNFDDPTKVTLKGIQADIESIFGDVVSKEYVSFLSKLGSLAVLTKKLEKKRLACSLIKDAELKRVEMHNMKKMFLEVNEEAPGFFKTLALANKELQKEHTEFAVALEDCYVDITRFIFPAEDGTRMPSNLELQREMKEASVELDSLNVVLQNGVTFQKENLEDENFTYQMIFDELSTKLDSLNVLAKDTCKIGLEAQKYIFDNTNKLDSLNKAYTGLVVNGEFLSDKAKGDIRQRIDKQQLYLLVKDDSKWLEGVNFDQKLKDLINQNKALIEFLTVKQEKNKQILSKLLQDDNKKEDLGFILSRGKVISITQRSSDYDKALLKGNIQDTNKVIASVMLDIEQQNDVLINFSNSICLSGKIKEQQIEAESLLKACHQTTI